MIVDPNFAAQPITPMDGLALRPKSVDISLTGRCNLQCRYCFYNDEMVALNDLPAALWLVFFQELGELAVQRVTLSGGELFTRPDLFEMIDGLIDNRMRYSILTNGTLVTESTLEAFTVGKRRLRLDSIQVSLDGSCAAVHNKSRPPDSFDRALRSLRLLNEAGFPVTVRVTINQHNVHDLENIAALLFDDLCLNGFGTNEAEHRGTALCNGQDVVLTEEQRQTACKTLMMLNIRYDNRISASAGPLARELHFKEIRERLARGETQIPGCGTLSACGGIFNKMAVLHDGTMVPCNMLPGLTMGKIGSAPLQEIWLHHPAIKSVRQRRLIPLSSLPECNDCEYTGFCTGGCPATVLSKFGKLNGVDPTYCYRQHLQRGEVR